MVHQWARAKSAIERDTQGHDHTSGPRDLVLATGPLEALGPLAFAQEEVKWRGERKKAKEMWGKKGYRSIEEQTRRASCTPAHSRPVYPTAPQQPDVCICIRERAYVCAYILMEVRSSTHFNTQMVESDAASGHHKPTRGRVIMRMI